MSEDPVMQVGQQVLLKMSKMIEAIREQGKAAAQVQAEDEQFRKAKQSEKNTQMLVSVLEEQFRTLETWLIPVHHSDADRVEYFKHLMGRFETMVSGYNRLIDALRKKYEPIVRKAKSIESSGSQQKGGRSSATQKKKTPPNKGKQHG